MNIKNTNDNPKFLALKSADALSEVKGRDIVILDLSEVSTFADYFVIVTGDSHIHMQALADHVRERMSQYDTKLWRSEGRNSQTWILLDYSSLIVHIFSKSSREFYSLAQLWGDAKEIPFSAESPDVGSKIKGRENGTWY